MIFLTRKWHKERRDTQDKDDKSNPKQHLHGCLPIAICWTHRWGCQRRLGCHRVRRGCLPRVTVKPKRKPPFPKNHYRVVLPVGSALRRMVLAREIADKLDQTAHGNSRWSLGDPRLGFFHPCC